ncbi:MAG: L,D-transpeptidase [Phycisphaerales bacterium]
MVMMIRSHHQALASRLPGWTDHAPEGTLLWVDVDMQRVWVIDGWRVVAVMPCSTAAAGLGEERGSLRTPRGWHVISETIGNGLPPEAILRSREWTGEAWGGDSTAASTDAVASGSASELANDLAFDRTTDSAGSSDADTDEDLILGRVLWLDGAEPGRNRGGDRDSHDRFIYLHGTNHPERLGHPASHGCVRVSCADIVRLSDLVAAGHPVWIG